MSDHVARPGNRPGPWHSGRLDIEGHRGARGVVPENTIPSFRYAIDVGCTGVELDVRLSADGEVVVWHDPRLEPAKCVFLAEDYAGARVDELRLDQLRTVDVGSRILSGFQQSPVPGARIVTLPELFAACADAAQLWWTVEIKVDPADARERATRETLTAAVVEAIHEAGVANRCFVHSFDWAVLDLARQIDPGLWRSALAAGDTYTPGSGWLGEAGYQGPDLGLVDAAAATGAVVLSPHHSMVTADLVRRAHECGLSVLPWTVNDPGDIARVVDAGVDGIVTDYPGRVLDWVG